MAKRRVCGLDRRGNWLAFKSRVQTKTSHQTRALANAGGAANEYERLQVLVGTTPVSQHADYYAAGNLVALDLNGDMNCDGVITGRHSAENAPAPTPAPPRATQRRATPAPSAGAARTAAIAASAGAAKALLARTADEVGAEVAAR